MGMDELEPVEDLEAHGAPATADALRSIVARHQRARTRTLGVALAVALVAGPLAGWAVGRTGHSGGQQVATVGGNKATPRDASSPAAAASGSSTGALPPIGAFVGPAPAPA